MLIVLDTCSRLSRTAVHWRRTKRGNPSLLVVNECCEPYLTASGSDLIELEQFPKSTQCFLSLFLLVSLLTTTALAADNRQAPLRKEKISAIVLHAIGGPVCKNNRVVFTEAPGDAAHWKHWFERQPSVSIHYIVDRKGEIVQSIDENRVAWHANDFNQRSIGIELVNKGDGVEAFPNQQIAALTALVKAIMARHQTMTKQRIVRHSDIDSRQFTCGGRKVDLKQDPGQKFPFKAFISQF